MSVFIKGIKKPKNCFSCDFNSSDCYCKINHGTIDRDFWDCDKECPIVEISVPHGDLIDRDFLKKYNVFNYLYKAYDAPTVIEAEGTE